LLVLVLVGVSAAIYVGLVQWTASSSLVNERHGAYNSALAAAEGAAETTVSYMVRDFFIQSFDPTRLGTYTGRVPTNDWAANYRFSDGAGNLNRTWVETGSLSMTTNLDTRFAGLYGLAYSCKVRANALERNTPYPAKAAVEENFRLASIPLFQFAIFYSLDLEINPGPAMRITGKVHSNANLYTAPGNRLEYVDTVTAVGDIINDRDPDDPQYGLAKTVPIFDASTNAHVPALSMPVTSNNVPAMVRTILDVPPFGEDPLSAMGKARLFNQVDLVVTTTTTGVSVKVGNWDLFAAVSPDLPGGYSFINTTNTFYDAREQKWTVVTDVDVAAFNRWTTNAGATLNAQALSWIGHPLNSIYVDDQRMASGKLTAVRVMNGATLPSGGLTVATALPLYVQGNFNAPAAALGTTNTAGTLPASLAGDAITILSTDWRDTNSFSAYTARTAQDTTVNTALMAGIVPTSNVNGVKHYSGGVENFPRFLENWGGKTFTYNGSMVVMFASKYATNFWNSPGANAALPTGGTYGAPNRNWAFDTNFKDYRRLPPATPQVRQLLRGQWSVVAAQ